MNELAFYGELKYANEDCINTVLTLQLPRAAHEIIYPLNLRINFFLNNQ